MLQRHLHRWAEELDERNYRVRMKGNVDRAANRAFDEGPTDDARLDGVLRQAIDARLRAAGIRPERGMAVLDVCAGRGHLGELLGARYGARVTFADLSLAQLSQLRRRLNGRGASNACAGDLLHLPYRSGVFDLVAGHSFLHHVPDVPAALAELTRVTRPGGTVALLHEPNLNASFWESFPLSLLKDTSPVEGFTDLWAFTPDDLRRLFTHAGLGDVTVRGTGIVSGTLLNWYLLVLGKAGMIETAAAILGYGMRWRLNRLETRWAAARWHERAPSLIVTARKPSTGAAVA